MASEGTNGANRWVRIHGLLRYVSRMCCGEIQALDLNDTYVVTTETRQLPPCCTALRDEHSAQRWTMVTDRWYVVCSAIERDE